MFIDTHCHPYLAKTKNEYDIIQKFKKSGGKYLISIWVDTDTSKKSVKLAKEFSHIFATVWIHPLYSNIYIWELDETIKRLEDLYLENKDIVVWIWECGIDNYRIWKDNNLSIEEEKQLQKIFFIAQIELAKKYNIPFIVHNRDAWNEILEILKQTKAKKFIIHCFSENLEFAKKCIEISPECMISFSGIVTFKNTQDIQKTVQNIPLENIIIETDSPYLTPVPFRWKEENEPAYTCYILDKIINLRDESQEKIIHQILKNSYKIFWLKKN